MRQIRFLDATMRDGSHALKQQLCADTVRDYCRMIDGAGMEAVIVGHGNGLGASSLQVGISKESDAALLAAARQQLGKTKLGVYLIPGFGTIRDDIDPAIEAGADLFKIGCHCTEADTVRQHMEYVRNKNKTVYGILMMYHLASAQRLLEEASKMQSYGAHGVILMDSAGASTPEMVKETVSMLAQSLNIDIGFHAHNNLGLAVANTYMAVLSGAVLIDGTLRGFGAGAGNCQLEAIAALLKKEGYCIPVDLYRMFDTGRDIVAPLMGSSCQGLDDISIVSGMAGVFSAFKTHVKRAAAKYGVDARDILMELGRQKTVAGQEDKIIEIAEKLSKGR